MKVTKHLRLEENMENIKRVVDSLDDNIDVHADLDIVTADAYTDNLKAEKRVEEIKDELEDKAEGLTPESDNPEVAVKNMYTDMLKLDESMDDFRLTEDGRSHAAENSGDWEEEYLEYDMARFVSGLCGGEDWPKPLSPIGKRMRTFQSGSRDKNVNTADGRPEALVGVPQVVPEEKYVTLHAQRSISKDELIRFFDGDKNRATRVYRSELGQIAPDSPDYELLDRTSREYYQFLTSMTDTSKLQSVAAFDDIKAACKIYELEYTNPIPKRSAASHWDYSMKVLIPFDESGLPMTLEDYFGGLRDAGNPYFAGLTDEEILYKILPKQFVKTYLNYKSKVEAEQGLMSREASARKLVDTYVVKASRDGSIDLNVFRNELEKELKALNVPVKEYLAKFDAEFADEYEDDDYIEDVD